MVFIGLIILLIGISIILESFFGLHISYYLFMYWPSILLIYGLVRLFNKEKSKSLSLFFVLIGLVVQLNFLKVIRINLFELIFAILLILIGFNILKSAIEKSKRKANGKAYNEQTSYEEYSNDNHSYNRERTYINKDFIDDKYSFTSENIQYISKTFSGGNLNVSFANVVLDLSQVESIVRDIDLNIDILFADVIIILPKNWHVIVNGRHYYSENESDIDTILTIKSDEKFGNLKIK